MIDLTKLVLSSDSDSFHNNDIYTGNQIISGSTAGGLNIRTFIIDLSIIPDLTDVEFNGAPVFGGVTIDDRPSDGWFKQGWIWVRGDNAGAGYTNYPTNWRITSYISGIQLIIVAYYVQTFTSALTLTNSTFYYRLVDYSVVI